jgi:thioredoxin reductase
MNNFDIAIIGGGPNGVYCLYELSKIFPKKKIILLEKKSIANNIYLYPNVLWHSLMGELKLPTYLNEAISDLHQPTSIEVAKYYQHFALEHDLKILENHKVTNITQVDKKDYNIEVLKNSIKFNIKSKVVILSTGIYENVNKLTTEIDHSFCSHQMDIKNENKNLVLVGHGNSAADFIIYQLPKNKIHWVIKVDKWKSIFSNIEKKFDEVMLNYKSNLKIYYNSTVKKIYSEKKIELSNGKLINNIDRCYFLIGFNSKNKLFDKIGLRYDNTCLDLDENYQTNLKIYMLLAP